MKAKAALKARLGIRHGAILKAIQSYTFWEKKFGSVVTAGMPNEMIQELVQPMTEAKYLIGSAALEKKLMIYAEIGAVDKSHAKDIKEVSDELVTLGKMGLGQVPVDQMADNEKEMIGIAKDALKNVQINVEGRRVTGKTSIDIDWEVMTEMVNSTFGAAARTQSANNIRQLGLALHNYHDAYRKFPPAVIIGENGHKHSWRIEVLPFLEQKALYDEYRFDEAWNSPHNQKVTAKMPEFFRHPEDDTESTNTSYFAIVGRGTVFGNRDGMGLEQITDGSSNTIMLIEAKKAVHWAQTRRFVHGRWWS